VILSSEGLFTCHKFLERGPSSFKMLSERLVILISKEGPISTNFNVLGLKRSVQACIDLRTYQSNDRCSNSEPSRLVVTEYKMWFVLSLTTPDINIWDNTYQFTYPKNHLLIVILCGGSAWNTSWKLNIMTYKIWYKNKYD
jgi:hypothetical protein